MSPTTFTDTLPRTNAIVVSYAGIRRAVGLSGFVLPAAMLAGGMICDLPIQDNLSSYYHTPLRDIFVGMLCAISVFLFCYRGHDWIENWTANLGSISALGVALFPLDAGSDPLTQRSVVGFLHTISGGVFFLTLALYSLYHFPRSGNQVVDDEPHRWERNAVYRLSGIVILLSMVSMGVYLFIATESWRRWLDKYNALFWLESIAAWSFALAWLTKGRAILADFAIELLSVPREIILPKVLRITGQRPNDGE